jgi:hypothetical protein
MKRLLSLFRVKKEERPLALAILLLLVFLNGMLVWHYHDTLTLFSDDYHKMFRDGFNISGFDAWTYTVLSKWSATQYNIYRHPLLAIFMLIPYAITQILNLLTGINCAIYMESVMQVFFGFYAFIFLYRILREVIGVQRMDASLLTFLFYSFAYVMLTVMVPDHFNFSLLPFVCSSYSSREVSMRKGQNDGNMANHHPIHAHRWHIAQQRIKGVCGSIVCQRKEVFQTSIFPFWRLLLLLP